jgi:hypothetical protein
LFQGICRRITASRSSFENRSLQPEHDVSARLATILDATPGITSSDPTFRRSASCRPGIIGSNLRLATMSARCLPYSDPRRCTSFDVHNRARCAKEPPEGDLCGACVRLLLMEQASARDRRLRHLSTSTTASASTFQRRVPLPPAFAVTWAPAPPWPFDQDLAGTRVASASLPPCDGRSLEEPRCADRFTSLDAGDPLALPCSRSRTFSRVPTETTYRHWPHLATRPGRRSPLGTHVHARVRLRLSTPPNTLTARVHIQRIVIEKVWSFRLRKVRPARAFEPSTRTFAIVGEARCASVR